MIVSVGFTILSGIMVGSSISMITKSSVSVPAMPMFQPHFIQLTAWGNVIFCFGAFQEPKFLSGFFSPGSQRRKKGSYPFGASFISSR